MATQDIRGDKRLRRVFKTCKGCGGHPLLLRASDDKLSILKEAQDMLERQRSQLVTLVDDLLEVSRSTHGSLKLRKRRVELAGLVRHTVEAANPSIEPAGQKLTVSLPEEPVHLDGDPNRLKQLTTWSSRRRSPR